MFGLKVTYLRGLVVAADVRAGQDKSEVEWPPHPDRLFCALVQAWGDLGEPEKGRDALRWLGQLPPPEIHCGERLPATNPPRYVPVNDIPEVKKGESAIQGTALFRVKRKRNMPYASLKNDQVVFWWPDHEPDTDLRDAIEAVAGSVVFLGHSSSFVSVEYVEKVTVSGETWLCGPKGTKALRVPYAGRFEELCDAYKADPRRRPPVSRKWANYGQPEIEEPVMRGHHKDMFIFRMQGDRPPLPVERTGTVIDVWRRALVAKADQPPIGLITGHAPESCNELPAPVQGPHLALFPLPDVGHRFARSHILGLAAALPSEASGDERKACLAALGRVEELNLGRLGKWRLSFADSAETVMARSVDTWCRPSRYWGSVTPLVIGRYPKDLWGEEAAEMICEACIIAGLPKPVDVSTAPVSWILGSPPSFRFPPLPARTERPRRYHVHARIEFEEPVHGPVLVGAGRHRGYGVFRQLSEGADEA